MKELNEIQIHLNAPKGKKNAFGGFKYRSLEDILEAMKPLLKAQACVITFTDDLQAIGERIFIKSTATITNAAGEKESSTSFAELDTHKGMSKEQATGSASSYARKYAVCSLCAIDDNIDVDSLDHTEPAPAPEKKTKAIFGPQFPTAWESAKIKYAEGQLTKEDIEARYLVTPTMWAEFQRAVELLNQ